MPMVVTKASIYDFVVGIIIAAVISLSSSSPPRSQGVLRNCTEYARKRECTLRSSKKREIGKEREGGGEKERDRESDMARERENERERERE